MTNENTVRLLIADHDSLRGGGQLGLRRYLSHASRFDRSVLTMHEGIVATTARAEGMPTYMVRLKSGPIGLLRTLVGLRRAIRTAQPDIVVTNSLRMTNFLALCLIRKRGTPFYVAYLREDVSRANLGVLKQVVMYLGSLQRFDGLLANSRWTASTVPRTILRKPLCVAYPISGIAATEGRPISAAAAPLKVISLSRLTEWKGIHILLEACALLSAAGLGHRLTVSIAGEGDPEDAYVLQLHEHAASRGVQVVFTGHLDDVDALLADHDVLAHCSLRPEAYGQVIPQALSHGLVVVATDAGGPAEMIDHWVTGLLVAPGDAKELAEQLRFLIENRDEAQALARAGRASASHYADETTVAQFEDALEAFTYVPTS